MGKRILVDGGPGGRADVGGLHAKLVRAPRLLPGGTVSTTLLRAVLSLSRATGGLSGGGADLDAAGRRAVYVSAASPLIDRSLRS